MTGRPRADLALVLVAAIWGATFVIVKDALGSLGPLSFLALRFALAAAVLVPVLFRARIHMTRAMVTASALAGLLLFAGFGLQTAGLLFTTPARAGFITGLSVALVPLGGALLVHTRASAASIRGAVLACGGLALLSLNPADLTTVGLGDLLVLGCAFAFAGHILLLGQVAPRHHAGLLTTLQILVAASLASAAAWAIERPTPESLLGALPAAAFTGLLATVGAFYVQTRAQRFTSASHTALIFTLEPVFAAGYSFLATGERLEWVGIVGCGLILAGMIAASLEPKPTSRPC